MIHIIAVLDIDPSIQEDHKERSCECNYKYNKIIYSTTVQF